MLIEVQALGHTCSPYYQFNLGKESAKDKLFHCTNFVKESLGKHLHHVTTSCIMNSQWYGWCDISLIAPHCAALSLSLSYIVAGAESSVSLRVKQSRVARWHSIRQLGEFSLIYTFCLSTASSLPSFCLKHLTLQTYCQWKYHRSNTV